MTRIILPEACIDDLRFWADDDWPNLLHAFSGRAGYTVMHDRSWEDRPWTASAVLDDGREYELPTVSRDAAIAACNAAEVDGFDAWFSGDDTPRTSADDFALPESWDAFDWSYRLCDDCGERLTACNAERYDDQCCIHCYAEQREGDRGEPATVPTFASAEQIYDATLPSMVAWMLARGVTDLNGVYGDAKPRDLDGSEAWHWDAARDTVFDHWEDPEHIPFWVHLPRK